MSPPSREAKRDEQTGNPHVQFRIRRWKTNWRDRVAALLEIVGVFITGAIVARLVGRGLGVPGGGIRDVPAGAAVDYLSLAAQAASNLLLRYGIILGLAFLIGWWYRRRSLTNYGVSTGGLSLREFFATAAVLFAAGGLLPAILLLAKDHIPLGREPGHWQLLSSPHSVEFWVYMAVGSFGLVPIVEELFFRGYVQTRLSESFGGPAAIVMTALLFTLSHRQYFIASTIGIGMLLSLFAASLFAGYTRDRFGTLLPGMIAHAIGNIPFRGSARVGVLIAILLILFVARRVVLAHLRNLLTLLSTRTILSGAALAVLIIAIVLSLVMIAPPALLPVGLAALLVALLLELRQKQTHKAV